MIKEKDYLETIEEHRQEVTLEETPKRRTRTKRKKQRNPFMTLLFIIFILFPAGILGYVVFLYEPEAPKQATKQEEQAVVQFEKNEDQQSPAVVDAEEKSEEDRKAEEEKVAAEAKAAEEAMKAAEEQAKKDAEALVKAEAEAKAKAAAEQATRQKAAANAKTHVVQSNETLYRIAMNYYNSPEGVQKIKQANNLPNETISVGQTLIIPQ